MSHKVLLVGPCLDMGGMERASVNTANGLQELGIEIVFVSFFKKKHFFQLNENVTLEEPKGFNKKKLHFLNSVLWLRKLIQDHQPDSVLVFSKLYGAITTLGILGISTSLYISERSSPFYKWKKSINAFNRFSYYLNPPSGVIAQTSIAAKHQRKYYSDKTKIKVIPNALRSIEVYTDIKREKVILGVGRLGDYLKGFDRLIEAYSLIENKEWQLWIAGGNEDGEYLKKQAKELGVQDRINFLGRVKEIDKIYAEAGIFVIPSRSEGFPNALCEAMAAGLPCISFDFIAGPKDIIEDGVNGILVEDGNIPELANQIDSLIRNKKERNRLSRNAKNIGQRFDPTRVAKQISNFILN